MECRPVTGCPTQLSSEGALYKHPTSSADVEDRIDHGQGSTLPPLTSGIRLPLNIALQSDNPSSGVAEAAHDNAADPSHRQPVETGRLGTGSHPAAPLLSFFENLDCNGALVVRDVERTVARVSSLPKESTLSSSLEPALLIRLAAADDSRSDARADQHHHQAGPLLSAFPAAQGSFDTPPDAPHESDRDRVAFAVFSIGGRLPNGASKENQDTAFSTLHVGGLRGVHLFGVADGHGPNGKLASSRTANLLPQLLCEELLEAGTLLEHMAQKATGATDNDPATAGDVDICNSGRSSALSSTTTGATTEPAAAAAAAATASLTAGELRELSQAFGRAIDRVQHSLLHEREHGDFLASGTTLACVLLAGMHLLCVNVGDSRVVLVRGGRAGREAAHSIASLHEEHDVAVVRLPAAWETPSSRQCVHLGDHPHAGSRSTLHLSLDIGRSSQARSHGMTAGDSRLMAPSDLLIPDTVACPEDGSAEHPPPSPFTAISLTEDHKPTHPVERDRILAAGGRIGRTLTCPPSDDCGPVRVWSRTYAHEFGLAMSRSIGDGALLASGVICSPTITYALLDPQVNSTIVIGTDGVWDVLAADDVAQRTAWLRPLELAAVRTCRLAERRWRRLRKTHGCSQDDITAVVVQPWAGMWDEV